MAARKSIADTVQEALLIAALDLLNEPSVYCTKHGPTELYCTVRASLPPVEPMRPSELTGEVATNSEDLNAYILVDQANAGIVLSALARDLERRNRRTKSDKKKRQQLATLIESLIGSIK